MKFKKIIKDVGGFLYYNSYKRYKNSIGNRTLIYHAFGMNLDHDTYGISIPINKFREHMIFIKENYTIRPLSTPFPDLCSVSITIDDGYKDTLLAADVLNNLNIPFSLFITSNNIDKKDYLTSYDIQQLNQLDICEIGSHGKTHSKLGDLDNQSQNNEVLDSKTYLENLINFKVESISLPHGSYNHNTFSIIMKNGYKRIATSIKGLNDNQTNNIIKRSEIIKNDNTTALHKKILGYYDYY